MQTSVGTFAMAVDRQDSIRPWRTGGRALQHPASGLACTASSSAEPASPCRDIRAADIEHEADIRLLKAVFQRLGALLELQVHLLLEKRHQHVEADRLARLRRELEEVGRQPIGWSKHETDKARVGDRFRRIA